MNYNIPQSHTLTQNQTSYTYAYIPKQTNESRTNVEPHTAIQSQKNIPLYREINNQVHIDIQSHTNIEAYDINSQTYTDIQPHSHTSVQSGNTNNLAHTNLQPNTIKTYSRTSHNTCASNVSQTSNTLHTYPTHNYTSHIETEETIHTNDILREFQDNIRTLSPQDGTIHNQRNQVHRGSTRGQHTLTHADTIDNGRTHNCVERVEAELKRMNTLLEKVLKCVQDRRHPTQKPDILPIASLTEMDRFKRIDEEDYSDVVNYLIYIGGFNLKEAINLCFKEAIKDALTPSFTWWGREEGQRPLYNARLTMAIYEAVCFNRYFKRPTRSEFQVQFREALRTAKERLRHRIRDSRTRSINRVRRNINRDLWSDERPEETNED